ncbi:hypothetical protein D1227_06245 [Henriciella mobilis]|uniref:hypothetical protein n=1 Tax=Henriciella mobilis TaxID=2305467 RepID=UPI000E66153F|nr:hypothetical protein [Henriciella mobilis]RIJ15988.1 hypothetical protein D1231_09355 [Henriciella mobilis]RIJ21198.1 hypothetical protein D1227_12895 [Henriciella mobilis]RIJ23101.1 hypothetical protein D1227_06245 [Henriciella mobilis]
MATLVKLSERADQLRQAQETFADSFADLLFLAGVPTSQESHLVEAVCKAIDRHEPEDAIQQALWRGISHVHDGRGEDRDTCLRCGCNFRHEIHRRSA